MKTSTTLNIATFAVVVMGTTWPAVAQDAPKPEYAADVPEFLLTPDQVETEFLGTLEFFDGMPSESTVQKTYDFLDLSRGVDAFLNGMPAASIYAFLEGLKEAGLEPGDLGITEGLLDARGLLLTAQSTTPYALAEIDLIGGPVVVEIPGPVLGTMPDVTPNPDGSYTVWFGPEAPKGHEGNWIQTLPGKSYLTLLRLYGPLEPWFDKTCKPGDFALVE